MITKVSLRQDQSSKPYWKTPKDPQSKTTESRVLRQSSFTGQWTLYCAGQAQEKPQQYDEAQGISLLDQPSFKPDCPFCPGNEHLTPVSLCHIDANGKLQKEGAELKEGWRARAIPNIFPLVVTPRTLYSEAHYEQLKKIPHSAAAEGLDSQFGKIKKDSEGKYVETLAVGFSELIIESPVHNGLLALLHWTNVSHGLHLLQERARVLAKQEEAVDILYFKQYGSNSGGSLLHPHFQIVTMPIVTPKMEARLKMAHELYEKHGECLTCSYVQQEKTTPLDDNQNSRSLLDTQFFAVAVPHCGRQSAVTITPKEHSHTWLDISAEQRDDLAYALQITMEALYRAVDDPDYDIAIVSADTEALLKSTPYDVKRTFHWRLEVQPRFQADLGGVEVASGIRVNGRQGLPEEFAQELRKVIQDICKERGDKELRDSNS